jgi:hypothetical protein
MRLFLVVTALCGSLLLNACAGQPAATPQVMRYSKAGASEQEFVQDRYACVQQAQQPRTAGYVGPYGGASRGVIVTNSAVFLSCMSAKGYSWGPEGTFAPAPETAIRMSD